MQRTTYRLSDAINLTARYGLTHVCLGEEHVAANPLVWVRQNWWPDGREVAQFIRARGKYRGNSLGFARR